MNAIVAISDMMTKTSAATLYISAKILFKKKQSQKDVKETTYEFETTVDAKEATADSG